MRSFLHASRSSSITSLLSLRSRASLAALASCVSLASLVVLASGCSFSLSDDHPSSSPKPPIESSTLPTNQMWPSMSAQSDGTSLKVYAALLKQSDFVQLSDGEYFSAKTGDTEVVLEREPYTDGKVHYLATFPANTASADVVIALHRAGGRVDALQSKTTVAGAFQITSPAPTSVKLGTTFKVTVSPPPQPLDGADADAGAAHDTMTVQYFGDCLEDTLALPLTFDAEGTATISTALLKLKKGQTTGCDVGVQIRHETYGKADPAFANADMNPVAGLQARGFTTAFVP
jgi:hypothetical protein